NSAHNFQPTQYGAQSRAAVSTYERPVDGPAGSEHSATATTGTAHDYGAGPRSLDKRPVRFGRPLSPVRTGPAPRPNLYQPQSSHFPSGSRFDSSAAPQRDQNARPASAATERSWPEWKQPDAPQQESQVPNGVRTSDSFSAVGEPGLPARY